MTLVFLYGPPAAGKLTVARELARLTNLRLFHNHLTIELAHEIFPERSEPFGKLVTRLRLDAIEAAAQAGVSLILTFVYGAGLDDGFVADVVAAVERHGGKVRFVQLLPNRSTLKARVTDASRRSFSKIGDWSLLEGLLDDYDLTTPIPESLLIDNSDLSPETAARQIVEELGLAPSFSEPD